MTVNGGTVINMAAPVGAVSLSPGGIKALKAGAAGEQAASLVLQVLGVFRGGWFPCFGPRGGLFCAFAVT